MRQKDSRLGRTFFALLLVLVLVPAGWGADRDELVKRVEAASAVLEEIMAAPDSGIPDEILGSAKCVAIVPSLLKGGFIFGGTYGRGVASCRTAQGGVLRHSSAWREAVSDCRSAARLSIW